MTTAAFDADPEAVTHLAGRTMAAVDTITDASRPTRLDPDLELDPRDRY